MPHPPTHGLETCDQFLCLLQSKGVWEKDSSHLRLPVITLHRDGNQYATSALPGAVPEVLRGPSLLLLLPLLYDLHHDNDY